MSVDVPSTSRTGAMATPVASASHNESATRWIRLGSMLMMPSSCAAACYSAHADIAEVAVAGGGVRPHGERAGVERRSRHDDPACAQTATLSGEVAHQQ